MEDGALLFTLERLNQIKIKIYIIFTFTRCSKFGSIPPPIIPPSYSILFLNRLTRLRYHHDVHATNSKGHIFLVYFPRVSHWSFDIYWTCRPCTRQHRFECSRVRTRTGWKKRVAPEKRKCVGGGCVVGRGRGKERERRVERVV